MTKCFYKAIRSEEHVELLKHPNEHTLLSLIAYRAKRTNKFTILKLDIGESLIGDLDAVGLTERQYRTAKKNLETWGFATFRATSKGTIAKITNSIVFDINQDISDDQIDMQATDGRRTPDDQATDGRRLTIMNKKDNKEKKENKKEDFYDFIASLKSNTAYSHIDIDNELLKMDQWFKIPKNKKRKKTTQFVYNWLNRIEKPISSFSTTKTGAQSDDEPYPIDVECNE